MKAHAERLSRFRVGFTAGLALALLAAAPSARAEEAVRAPDPAVDTAAARTLQTAVFAGGCFWGVEGVFSHVKGVRLVRSGYAGGPRGSRVDYDEVSSGKTRFAEAVSVTWDPRQVSYGTLMRVFFSVIADPTTLDYQGPDHGPQYRSALFPLDREQASVAKAYLAQLGKSGLWDAPIVTKLEPFTGFVPAERHHQDFMARHPRHPYILRWDVPKLAAFRRLYPDLYRDKPAP